MKNAYHTFPRSSASFYPILTLVPCFFQEFSLLLEYIKIIEKIYGLNKPKILKNFLHILKVEKISKKSRVQALKSDKNSRSYEGKYNMHFFMVFGVILPILGNPLEIL